MMRPVSVALPPVKADGLTSTSPAPATTGGSSLTWTDNSITETSFLVQRTDRRHDAGPTSGPIPSPLDQPNTTGPRSFTDATSNATIYLYRVVAQNTVGYGGGVPEHDRRVGLGRLWGSTRAGRPDQPDRDHCSPAPGRLTWRDNATNESRFVVQRSSDGGAVHPDRHAPAADEHRHGDLR